MMSSIKAKTKTIVRAGCEPQGITGSASIDPVARFEVRRLPQPLLIDITVTYYKDSNVAPRWEAPIAGYLP
jgi:hypothetical protein